MFVVLGLVFVATIALILQLNSSDTTIKVDRKIPQQVEPVYLYIESCMDSVMIDAIQLLGIYGGYTTVPDEILNNPYRNVPLSPNSVFRVPYWYYQGSFDIPTNEEVEEQISSYVKQNLPSCIANFTTLNDQFDILVNGDMQIETTFGRKDVTINMDWPLDISNNNGAQVTSAKDFLARRDVRLQDLMNIARETAQKAVTQTFFEDFTLNLMSLNEKTPLSGIEFSCGKKVWYKNQVRDELIDMMSQTVRGIRIIQSNHVEGKDNPYYIEGYKNPKYIESYFKESPEDGSKTEDFFDPEAQQPYAYRNYVLGIDQEIEDISIMADYRENWPMTMYVNPSNGNRMKASSGDPQTEFLKFFCMNTWHFTYDIEYPVLISIRDDTAFIGEGFILNFALPVNINHNIPDKTDYGITPYSTLEVSDNACQPGDTQIEVQAYDAADIEYGYIPMKNVDVTFDCLGRIQCPLGKTSAQDGLYKLKANVPDFCNPGSIIVEKEGFLPAKQQITSRNVGIDMIPLKQMEVQVMKKRSNMLDLDAQITNAQTLFPGEVAIISIESKEYPEYFQSVTVDKDGLVPVELSDDTLVETTFELLEVPTTYDLTIIYQNSNEEFIGGYFGNFTVTDISSLNQITFYVFEQIPHPANDDSITEFYMNLYEEKYNPYLKPTII